MQRAATESRSNALRNCSMVRPEDLRPQSGRVWNWRPGLAPLAATQLAATPPGTGLAGMALAQTALGQCRSAALACSPAPVRARALTQPQKGQPRSASERV